MLLQLSGESVIFNEKYVARQVCGSDEGDFFQHGLSKLESTVTQFTVPCGISAYDAVTRSSSSILGFSAYVRSTRSSNPYPSGP